VDAVQRPAEFKLRSELVTNDKKEEVIKMKYLYGILLWIMALISTQAYGANANILTNPGFESGTTGWSAFGGSFTTVSSNPSPHSGSLSGRAYSRTNTWNGILQSVLNKMVVGQTYTISGWVRTASPSADIHLTFAKTDSNGTAYAWGATGTANNTSWTYISGSYTLTANGTITALNLYVESSDLNDIYLDDANVFGQVPGPTNPNATGSVNFNTTFQKLEGFGAAGAWYENWLLANPQKNTLYDILFRDLGLDIYRVRNCYGFDGGYINNTEQIIQAAKARNPSLKILNSAWSPPAYLKSNNDTNSYPPPGTLKKDANDSNNSEPYYYVYKAYAKWWADSLTAYESNSIHSDYMSIQNEPDYEATYESCKFLATETASYAGYNQAFEAVYQKLNSTSGPNMPKMLAPETMGFGGAQGYINSLINTNHVYGYAHHLYSDGDYDSPDSFITGMQNFGSVYGYKPLLQTEYERLSAPSDDFTAAMNMALHIHNSLVYEGVCSYFHWSLFWGGSSGLVTLPSYGTSDYVINPTYYTLKHYSKFTDPGWYRVDANTSDSNNLRITAFKDPCEPNASIVVINTSTTTDINLMLSLTGFSPSSSEIYQTKSDANFAYLGTFSESSPLSLPHQSITTIHLTGSTYDLNGDGSIDWSDVGVLAENWLVTNPKKGDFNGDKIVNFLDFAEFMTAWQDE
jgi:glucuronoarabinoxylan endo-1,4-beta-xylanase